MDIRANHLTTLTSAVVLCLAVGADAATNDRHYRMGDGETGLEVTDPLLLNATFDGNGLSTRRVVDLDASGGPSDRTDHCTSRWSGGLGYRIEWFELSGEFSPGLLDTSFSADGGGGIGTLDDTGIKNRGLANSWVKPSCTGVETNGHG